MDRLAQARARGVEVVANLAIGFGKSVVERDGEIAFGDASEPGRQRFHRMRLFLGVAGLGFLVLAAIRFRLLAFTVGEGALFAGVAFEFEPLLFCLPAFHVVALAQLLGLFALGRGFRFEIALFDDALAESFDGRGHGADLIGARTVGDRQFDIAFGKGTHDGRDLADRTANAARQCERDDQPEQHRSCGRAGENVERLLRFRDDV